LKNKKIYTNTDALLFPQQCTNIETEFHDNKIFVLKCFKFLVLIFDIPSSFTIFIFLSLEEAITVSQLYIISIYLFINSSVVKGELCRQNDYWNNDNSSLERMLKEVVLACLQNYKGNWMEDQRKADN
jgi:hypothetical protein